ncbi:hypothetical protein EDD15DRAFT_2107955, partial [Pisolithus albus]
MQAWIAEVRRTAFQLQEVDVSVSDEDIILVLTLGLPTSYESFVVSLDTTPPDQLTLDYVITRLMNEEAWQSHSSSVVDSESGALLTSAQNRARLGRRVALKNITCFNCGEKGHYQSHCPKHTA